MPYTVTTTAGAAITTVADGTVDTTSTSLTLIGKNYAGYGIFLNENFVKTLENFSNNTPPTNPLTGQLWYDNFNDILKVYNSTSNIWKPISSSIAQATAPSASVSVTGDIWWDTTNSQLKVWSGSAWITIGPSYTSTSGTSGPITQTILDNASNQHVVVVFYISNQAIAIIANAQFTLPVTSTFTGFSTIYPGMNLISQAALSGSQYTGSVPGATTLNGYAASYYMSNIADFTTTHNLTVNGSTGLTLNSDLVLNAGGAQALIQETTQSKNIQIQLNSQGSLVPVLTLASSTLTAQFANAVTVTNGLTAGTVTAGSYMPTANATVNLGTPSMIYANVYAKYLVGTSIQANYADLAERFEADVPMVPGTVVEIGGVKEITAAVQALSDKVFGVISTAAGFLMNGGAGNNQTHPPIAVNGRVPVRVIGTVNKGDRLVSAGNGLARAAAPGEATAFNVIGRALEDKTTQDESLLEAIVKINS